MTNKRYVVGIDTSNYTTSLSLISLERQLVVEKRRLLPVKPGEVGLRQSDALFHHIKNLPEMFQELLQDIAPQSIAAISGATKPRPLEESYMPVFMAAKSYGETLGSVLKVPFYEFSHQEGHIEAGLWSINQDLKTPFLGLHLSGGTTELLEVAPHKKGYHIKLIGGTGDLSAGQFVDRIGVKLGLPFPAGPHLEMLAKEWQGDLIEIPISVKGTTVSYSGPETFLQRLIEKDPIPAAVARSLFHNLGMGLVRLIKNALKLHPYDKVLLVGGVASNSFVREIIFQECKKRGIEVHFAIPQFCSDNGIGIGLLGVKGYAD